MPKRLRRLKRSTGASGQKPRYIKRYRYDITNEEVKEKLDAGYTVKQCCSYFNCSKNLINSVIKGKRPEPPPRKVGASKTVKLCSSCGLRPVKKGNRFLCEYCFSKYDNEDPHSLGLMEYTSYSDIIMDLEDNKDE